MKTNEQIKEVFQNLLWEALDAENPEFLYALMAAELSACSKHFKGVRRHVGN